MEAVLRTEIISEPKSNLEEKGNLSVLKVDFSTRTDASILTSVAPVLLHRSNKTSYVFQALKSTSHLLPSQQCLIDQIQGQKLILVVATDKMPDQT